MEKKIKIKAGNITAEAWLNDSATAQKIWDILPIEAKANTWGDEIYFPIPVKAPLEKNAQELVNLGDLGYWPEGKGFCIFFGPTPISRGDEIKPASAVNIIGKLMGDPKIFKKVRSGDKIIIERAEE